MTVDPYESLVRIAGPVSRETFLRLCAFESLFRRWAESINLTAPSTLPELWTRHILDSAQIAALAADARHWVDFGSGGGFPGAVLAILMAGDPDIRVDLVESNQKKAAFLKTALAAGAPGATVHAIRAEQAVERLPRPDVVTARAFAALPNLLRLSSTWLGDGAIGLFHKGRDYPREVENSRVDWRFDLVEHPSAIEPGGAVLEIRNLVSLR